MKEQKTSKKSKTQWKLEGKGRKRHTKSKQTNKQNKTERNKTEQNRTKQTNKAGTQSMVQTKHPKSNAVLLFIGSLVPSGRFKSEQSRYLGSTSPFTKLLQPIQS